MIAERRRTFSCVTACLFLLMAGCSSPPAPIDSRQPPPSIKINEHYVSKGDTLYSIAWMYEKDVHKLARANGLRTPYTIYQGQRLTLDTSRVKQTRVIASGSPSTGKSVDSASTGSSAAARATSRASASGSSNKGTATPSRSVKLPDKWRWQWPVPGSVTRSFNSSSLFKGLDLRVRPGQPVVAAAPGIVVYAGSGLRGYGKMIIIKHSDVYLSAYAHNRKILVREGQVINSGQKISEAGGDPANPRRLYFEIRKDGKPVDPRRYLPGR